MLCLYVYIRNLVNYVNPIYPGKDCPGTKNWAEPEARAFGTFIYYNLVMDVS